MKKIVITGGTGLIGKQLIKILCDRGDEVIAFVRDIKKANLPIEVKLIEWSSGMNVGKWVDSIDGTDAIINLAGSPVATKWTEQHKIDIYNSRVNGTRILVEAIKMAKKKPSVLINGSAIGYYGTHSSKVFDETSPAGNDFLGTVCKSWEDEAFKAEELGVRVTTIRTGVVLDLKGGALPKQITPFKMFVGGPILPGTQPYPWIHIEDELGIILWALDNENVKGPINATAPDSVNNKEFSKALAKSLKRPCLFPVPSLPMKILFGEGAIIVLEGQKAIPKKALELGYKFKFDKLSLALRNLIQ
ncbi:MAG: TIGR01777 family protein [Chlorobiota bacterium]|jgi:uncharacterized protein (TIGR01777 family)|nr:TIGR01777 family protein [Chlorobiota bacterium]QQS66293.1 MAG: TIGR01777 family protein [Chlorobiota bacterium]